MNKRTILIKLILKKQIWNYNDIKHKKINELLEIIYNWYQQQKINDFLKKWIISYKIKKTNMIQNIELIKLINDLKTENMILQQTINNHEIEKFILQHNTK